MVGKIGMRDGKAFLKMWWRLLFEKVVSQLTQVDESSGELSSKYSMHYDKLSLVGHWLITNQ